MADEILLNKSAGTAFKNKLKQLHSSFEEDDRSFTKVERLSGKLKYATSMASSIQQARRGTSDTIKRLEVFQREYEVYERAIEEWDQESAQLLGIIPLINPKDIGDVWPIDSVMINPGVLDPGMGVRSTFESRDDVESVDWERTEDGKSKITITFNNGEPPKVLVEGVDYYIEGGKAYFYNNVRAIMEATGATVDYQKTPGGGSTIGIMEGGVLVKTLVEGSDYFIGADGKAHFLDETNGPLPPGAKQNVNTIGGGVPPIAGGIVTSNYGMRGSKYHNGIDIGKGYESGVVDVVSMYSGTVINVDYNSGYGYYIDVKSEIDGDTVVIRYAHFHEGTINVNEGDSIAAGKDIGKMGSSGNSTGPHVHIEVQVNPPNGEFSFANNNNTRYNPNSTNPSSYIPNN